MDQIGCLRRSLLANPPILFDKPGTNQLPFDCKKRENKKKKYIRNKLKGGAG